MINRIEITSEQLLNVSKGKTIEIVPAKKGFDTVIVRIDDYISYIQYCLN